MKKLRVMSLILALVMVLGLITGCGSKGSSTAKVSSVSEPKEMTYDELVAAAKQDGKLVFYGANSFLEDAGKKFAEEFGIEVEFTQLGETEMIEKVSSECKGGSPVADLVCAQDTYRVQSDLLNTNYAMNWTNSRINGNDDCTASVWYYDTKMFMYNPTLVGEDWAVNLWRITDPLYKGQFTIKTPASEGVNFDMLTMLTSDEYAKKLADAYEAYYGTPIKLTTDNAGWEFVKMMYENGVVLTTSDSTCATTIGDLSLTDTWLGYFSTQRYSTQEKKGIKLAFNFKNTTPVAGYSYPVYAIVLNGCSHSNAAKLFSEWLLSSNGWAAFESYYGGFSANPANSHMTDYSYEEVKPYLVTDDAEYLLTHRADMEDFVDSLS